LLPTARNDHICNGSAEGWQKKQEKQWGKRVTMITKQQGKSHGFASNDAAWINNCGSRWYWVEDSELEMWMRGNDYESHWLMSVTYH